MKVAKLRQRISFAIGRTVRATLGFAVSGTMLVLLWRGWFRDLRQPGGDLRLAGAAGVLTLLLGMKIAARVRTAERRRTPRREALSDAELGFLLLTVVYVLLAVSGRTRSPVHPVVYAPVSFLGTFHRLAVSLPLAACPGGLGAVLSFPPHARPPAPA